ncbi:MAG: hypothetical protein RBU30_09520 [Polyangia bacterium]|nr:hypothetical protein [Polyangia bacterium]
MAHDVHHVGGAMNLNPHAHAALTDGLFVPTDPDDPDSPLLFVPLPPPTDFDIEALLRAICRRILRIARRFQNTAAQGRDGPPCS